MQFVLPTVMTAQGLGSPFCCEGSHRLSHFLQALQYYNDKLLHVVSVHSLGSMKYLYFSQALYLLFDKGLETRLEVYTSLFD